MPSEWNALRMEGGGSEHEALQGREKFCSEP